MKKKIFSPLILILILGLALRLIAINQSFWLDEATSATVARDLSIIDILYKFSPGDFHPPLYYLLLKIWTLPLGVSEITTRLFSLLTGVLTIYISYLVGEKLRGKELGLIASFLLATSPLHIYYSQEARMYSLATLFVSLAFYGFIKVLKKGNFYHWVIFSLSIMCSLATEYLTVFAIPVFFVIAFISKKKAIWWTKFLIAYIPLSLFMVWWAPIFLKQLFSGLAVKQLSPGWWGILGRFSLKEIVLIPVKFILGRISFYSRFWYAFIVFVVVTIFTYTILRVRKETKRYLSLVLWLLLPVFLTILLSIKISVLSYFRLLFVLPAFYLLVAAGLLKVRQKYFPLLFMAISLTNITFSLYYLLNTSFHREDWRGLVNYIQENSIKDDTIVLFPAGSQMEAYRYYLYSIKDGVELGGPEDFKADHKQVWLMRYVQPVFDPEDNLRKRIEENLYLKELEKDFNGVVVWKYEK